MSVLCELKDKRKFLFTKGAPDFLLPHCSSFVNEDGQISEISNDFRDILAHRLSEFASHSLRTLLLCYKKVDGDSEKTENAEDL